MTKCVIYCRVSTAAQEDNTSLETQLADCRAYAMDRGWLIVGELQEVQSGADYWERPRLQHALDSLRDGMADVLLVRTFDRLSRDPRHQSHARVEAERVGAIIESATEAFDESIGGQIHQAVTGVLSEDERKKIRARTMRGKRQRAESGKLIPGRKAPYGLEWDDEKKTHLAADPATSPIVERMYRHLANGGSATGLAHELTKEGLLLPTGKLSPWSQNTILKIMRNPVYKGQPEAYRYLRTKGKGKKRDGTLSSKVTKNLLRPPAERISLPEGLAPVLVSPEIWERALAQVDQNRANNIRNNRHPEDFLLRAGFIRCGHCGGAMVARAETRKGIDTGRRYYLCSKTMRDLHGCPGFWMNAKDIDREVTERLLLVLGDAAFYEQFVAGNLSAPTNAPYIRETEVAIAERTKRISRLLGQLEFLDGSEATAILERIRELKTERTKLESNLEAARQEAMVERDRKAELEKVYEVLAARLRSVGDHEGAESLRDADPATLLDIASIDPSGMWAESLDYAEKRKWLDILGFQVRAKSRDDWEITSTIEPERWDAWEMGYALETLSSR